MTEPLSEAQFQAHVLALCHATGWRACHTRKSIGRRQGARGWQTTTSVTGWPDLVCWSPHGGLLFAELKSETGKVTPEQAEVHASLRAAGQTVHVWRPSDLDQIARILSRRREHPSGTLAAGPSAARGVIR